MTDKPLSGRKAQAARNDKLILEAAQEVFVADPEAPIAEVAKRAGVGISALYRRYPSKEDLVRKLCSDGLARYTELVREALEDEGDPWEAFRAFMRGVVSADTPSITVKLAGTFTPTPDMFEAGVAADALNRALIVKLRDAGVLREEVENGDLALVTESIASINLGSGERTRELRLRALELYLEALRAPGAAPLPGTAPSEEEMGARWVPKNVKE
ncbi:TetR/AcrR family transcriptional regulator [Glycomyces sp. TRM65418]|uniref:TetR/AcrR family transcriptional regulator n=1 Tax=Glycomyces sp. TRM65418 TaxID=2867006 RepID=UPI001CE5CD2E|nr:TetR/AcrR family transcriptional regulator [Glycomyces sp. TRM65418]MCC3761876.1 TetR/AcrR family transcriptional regulator [Glycomyces sp. TRM65418]QZD55957.1 TetR/AcrR family transcriptional regulator [Glycomyces sp. TRM65418]